MDKKTKILFSIFGLLIVASVAFTFYRTIIRKDYIISNQVDCDPVANNCFVWECDSASDVEGEKCTGDADADIWYYQIAQRSAGRIPLCDPDNDETCDPWTCPADEKDCATTFCDDLNKTEQGVECSDPVQYNVENPPVEEETVCAESDVECASSEPDISDAGLGDAESSEDISND